ncbi:hypothetical protein L1889_18310 [Paenalcaligenes niemegkensis]|uniref:hypothetical protein n=1 Tax=Paenalcaligenes niemegkensis TaxID=2895469 RepID=UPI001EE7B5BD|nr:hypothetical protein [Paenalcaligenes niemegkensis]MCQ9618394.1 hypothetical protein [Paenalcaligenes niemegkensis]
MAKGWSKSPVAFIKVVESDLVDKRKEITATALQAVVSGSPVDTGAYKANHRVTLDGVDLGYDLDAKDPSGSQALADGEAVIGQIDTPFGESVIQNNLPYSETLELGHSQQAPQGTYGPAFVAVQEKYTK